MQEGVVGVLRALEHYDPEFGTPFWAYASWWVRQAMQQVVSELSGPVVLSDRALRQLAHVRDTRRMFLGVHGREPNWRELATASELTVEQLQRLAVAERAPRGLQEPVDATTGGETTFGDLLLDPRAEEAYEELMTSLGAPAVPRLLEHLSERERTVIEARYGLNGRECTLRELGEMLGVSAERVRQIQQVALQKMRCAYSREYSRTPARPRKDAPMHPRARPTLLAGAQGSSSGPLAVEEIVLDEEYRHRPWTAPLQLAAVPPAQANLSLSIGRRAPASSSMSAWYLAPLRGDLLAAHREHL
jgi:RNA polymerase sigma factor (sigma-70 family)